MISSSTTNKKKKKRKRKRKKKKKKKKKKKRRSKRRKLGKVFLRDPETQMSCEHEQQPKLHGKQCYGLTWACCIHVLLFAKYFSESISKTQPIYFFTSLSVEVSG